jgi:site-specific recombinase XerD
MKLVSTQVAGRKIRRVYDAAKTPLQRALLSGALSPAQQQELRTIGKAFVPFRLFQQVEQLQQATLRCEAVRSSAGQPAPLTSLVPFDLASCAAELVLSEGSETDEVHHEEQILAWVRANPTRSSGDILRELQSLFPGRYEFSHLRTLQRGMRKMRAHLLQTHEGAGSSEEPRAHLSLPAELKPFLLAPESSAPSALTSSKPGPSQIARCLPAVSSPSATHPSSPEKSDGLTIERAVQEYLQAHRTVEHRPKTLEWHLMALSHLRQYVLSPRTSVPLPHVVSPATFEEVMRASFSRKTKAPGAKRTALRDQALLWVLFETGMTVSEVCALRVADLDLQAGLLRVRGKGGQERLMPLGATCLSHLRAYLKQMEPTTKSGLARRRAGGDPLCGSREKQPLTRNGVTMVFARFRTRAGLSDIPMSPQILRHSFALRYLQAGGDPQGLRALLGYEGMAPGQTVSALAEPIVPQPDIEQERPD